MHDVTLPKIEFLNSITRRMTGALLPLPLCWDLVNSTRRLILDRFELLPSTVLMQTGYQMGEGYAKNISSLCQAQQIC